MLSRVLVAVGLDCAYRGRSIKRLSGSRRPISFHPCERHAQKLAQCPSKRAFRSHEHAQPHASDPCGLIEEHPSDLIPQWRKRAFSSICSNLLSACNPSMSGSGRLGVMPGSILGDWYHTRTMIPYVECSSASDSTHHNENSCHLRI